MDIFTPLNLFGDPEVEMALEKEEEPLTVVSSDEQNGTTDTTEPEEVKPEEVEPEMVEPETAELEVEPEDAEPENTEEKDSPEDKTVESEPQSDRFEEVLELQKSLSEQMESLKSLFNTRIMHTDHEEKIVDQMHKELQKYKEDMYAQLVRPILLDVIAIRDSVMRMAATYLAKPEGEQNIPNKTFADYAYDLQDILEKNSVEIYRSAVGDAFVPVKQRVIKKVITDDESLHGKVAETFSCGYSYNERVISAEKIAVYYYEKNVEKNENSEVIENG